MANNKNQLDDLNFDNLDFDKLVSSQERSAQGGKREALTRVTASFAEGARQSFTSPEHIRRLTSAALPKGYGSAINTGYEAYRGTRELYNIAAKELKPALPIMRRAVARLTPKQKSYLPSSVARKLEEFAAGGEAAYRRYRQEDADNDTITRDLAGIFRVQLEAQGEMQAAQMGEMRIREEVRDHQNLVMAARLEHIRLNSDRLVQYQDQVTAKFQRKSLELQYRQYFALRDIYKQQSLRDERDKVYLDALVRNTGLSDYAKSRMSEASRESFRDRLIGKFQDTASSYASRFTQDFTQNIGRVLKDSLSSAVVGAETADSMADAVRSAREAGMDPKEEAARSVGGFAAEKLGNLLSPLIRKFLSKNKKLARGAAKASYLFDNLPERLNELAQTDDGDTGYLSSFKRKFRDLLPRFGLDSHMGGSPLTGSDAPAQFDNLTRRSITEIIPGYLSRIHHEIAMMRTGNNDLERTTYNLDRGSFTSMGSAAKDAQRRILHPSQVGLARSGLNEFVDTIDKKGDLTGTERTALMRQIMADVAASRPFNPKRYTSLDELTPALSGEIKEKLAGLFNKKFKDSDGEENYEELAAASLKFKELQNVIPNPKAIMSVYRDTGQRELLEQLGLITKQGMSDRVNFDTYFDSILKGDTPLGAGGPTSGPSSPGRSGPGPGGGSSTPGWVDRVQAGASSVLGSIRDIYVRGMQSPALQAARVRAGEYFDQVSGKVISTMDDIRGPVIDRAGNVILSAQDFAAGLFDSAGRQLTDLSNRTRERAESLLAAHDRQSMPGMSGNEIGTAASASMGDNTELVRLNGEQVTLLKGILEVMMSQSTGKAPRGGFLDRLAIGGVKGGWKAMKVGAKGYWAYLKGLTNTARWGLGTAGRAVSGGAGMLRDLALGNKDIYVKDGTDPVMLARKLKQNHYQDVKTGKPIRKIKDVTGQVIDISEGGRVVLTEEQFNEGLYTKGPTGLVRFTLGKAGAFAKAVIGGYFNVAKLPFMALGAAAKGAKAAMGMMFNKQVDIYVKGENKPRLRAVLMKGGKYYSAKSGKLIRGFDDIDGEVKQKATNGDKASPADTVVLTEEEIRDPGIVNSWGQELKTPAQRLLGVVGRMAGGIVRGAGALIGGAARGYGKLMGGLLGGAGNLFGGTMKRFGAWFNPKEFGAQSKKQTTLLEKIYALLDQRMPGKPIREGSWQDQFAENAVEKKEKEAAKKEAEAEKKSGFGAFLSWAKSKAGGLFGAGDGEEDDGGGDDGDTTIIGGGGGAGDDPKEKKRKEKEKAAKRDKRRKGKLGLFYRAKDKIAGMFSRGKGAAPAAAAAGSVAKKPGMFSRFKPRGFSPGGIAASVAGMVGLDMLIDKVGADSTAGKALDTGMNVAGTAMTAHWLAGLLGLTGGGGAAAGGTAAGGTAAATLGGGALATIGLPVALAVAAVGYVGYKGYKKYKYGTYMPLRAYRLAQYGVPYQETSQVEKIVDLEQMLTPHVQQMGGGLDISSSKLSMQEIYKLFGLEDGWFSNKTEARNSFDVWFSGRFKPVFLTWLKVVRDVKADLPLNDADEMLASPEKERVLKAAHGVGPQVLNVKPGPFDGAALTMGPAQVEDAYLDALSYMEKDKTLLGRLQNKGRAMNAVVSGMMPFMGAGKLMEWSESFNADRDVARLKADPARLAALTAGTTAAGTAELIKGGGGGAQAAPTSGNISAGGAVRMRAYGLIQLAIERVSVLRKMEQEVWASLKYDANGTANFSGDVNQYLANYCGDFGFAANDPIRSQMWLAWFRERFLAVALRYASVVKRLNKSADPKTADSQLKPEQLFELASDTVKATQSNGRPVWAFVGSPWGSYDRLNDDSKSTYPSMLVLRQAFKKGETTEPSVAGSDASVARNREGLDEAAALGAKPGAWSDKLRNWMTGGDTPNALGRGINAVRNWWGGDAAPTAAPVAAAVSGGGSGGGGSVITGMPDMGGGGAAPSMVMGGGSPVNVPLARGMAIPGLNVENLWKKVAPLIGLGESMGGNYDAQNGVPKSITPGLSSMTIGEVHRLSSSIGASDNRKGPGGKWINGPKTGAAGKYQFIPKTLLAAMKTAGLKATDKFSPENQEKMGRALFDMRVKAGMNGGVTGILDQLAMEWASLPSPSKGGRSWYHGDSAGNRAHGGQQRLQELMAAVSGAVGVGGGAGSADGPANSVVTNTPDVGGLTGTTAGGPQGGLGPALGAMLGAPAGPVSLPGGRGYAEIAAGIDAANPASRIPVPAVVPSIDRGTGIPMPAPNGSEHRDEAIVAHRRALQDQANAADLVGQRANADIARQMGSVVEVLNEQLLVQKTIVSKLDEAVGALKDIRTSAAAQAGGPKAGDSVPSTSAPGTARGERPLETPAQRPTISVRPRRISAG